MVGTRNSKPLLLLTHLKQSVPKYEPSTSTQLRDIALQAIQSEYRYVDNELCPKYHAWNPKAFLSTTHLRQTLY